MAQVLRLAWLPLLLSACCLEVVPVGTGGSSGLAGVTSGGGTGGHGASTGHGPAGTSNTGTTSGGGGMSTSPTCIYPVAGSGIFPDVTLGDGWLNLNGAVDSATPVGSESDVLHALHCSGERYLLIDISAVWAPNSAGFANAAPGYVAGWLAQGGLVLTILEQNASDTGPATDQDIGGWVKEYQTNYSLVNDPNENLITALGIGAWPSSFIVRLSDMEILQADEGYSSQIFQSFTSTLNGN